MLLREQLKDLVARAKSLPLESLEASSNEDLATALESRFPLETPLLEANAASRSPIREVVVPREDYGRRLEIQGFELTVSVPVSGSAYLMLWEPSGYRASLPPGELRDNAVDLTYRWIPSESPNFEDLLSRDLADIRWWMNILARDIAQHRQDRRKELLAEIQKKRETARAAEKLISGSFLEKLPIQAASKGRELGSKVSSASPIRNRPVPAGEQVFISYAREDENSARGIASFLESKGFSVWIDKKRLLGGQNWKNEIRKAIKSSRYFIALLSASSVEKAGYVQNEVREALSVLESMPPNAVFVVPVRLDPVTPQHPQLEELHWIDAFPELEQSLEKIGAALETS